MITYRPDIDGLRALAVIAVVLNHAHVRGFGGGFAGVDVFFVISGYLITQILLREDVTPAPRLWRFYERRIRRIVPAPAVMLAASIAAALVLLSPYEIEYFVRTLATSTLFGLNIQMARHIDYFTPAFNTPLLHLWSLSVEEQFYLLYPLALAACLRRGRHVVLIALLAVFVASLALSQLLIAHYARWAFFFTGSRAWELMLGALPALYPLRARLPGALREVLAMIGLGLVAVAFIQFDAKTPWPGLHALVPCIGAALLIALHDGHATLVSRGLSAKPVVGIGLISYSLYLWHWPLFEFYQRWVLRQPTPGEFAVLIAIALVLAILSWRFVEQPFRKPGFLARPRLFAAAAVTGVALLAVSGLVHVAHGLPSRFAPPVRRIYATLDTRFSDIAPTSDANICFAMSEQAGYPFGKCFVPSQTRPNVVLWGDSFARNLITGLRAASQGSGINLIQANYFRCRPVLVHQRNAGDCDAFNRAIVARLDKRISAVILSGHFLGEDFNLPYLREVAAMIARRGVHVILLGPSPEYREAGALYAGRFAQTGDRRWLDSADKLKPDMFAFDAHMRASLDGLPGVSFVSVLDAACPSGKCPMITADGLPTAFDYGHLTRPGSLLIGRAVWPRIAAALGANSPPPGR